MTESLSGETTRLVKVPVSSNIYPLRTRDQWVDLDDGKIRYRSTVAEQSMQCSGMLVEIN